MSEADHSQGMKKAAKDKRLPWYPAVFGMGEHWSIPKALSTGAMHSAWELRAYFCVDTLCSVDTLKRFCDIQEEYEILAVEWKVNDFALTCSWQLLPIWNTISRISVPCMWLYYFLLYIKYTPHLVEVSIHPRTWKVLAKVKIIKKEALIRCESTKCDKDHAWKNLQRFGKLPVQSQNAATKLYVLLWLTSFFKQMSRYEALHFRKWNYQHN